MKRILYFILFFIPLSVFAQDFRVDLLIPGCNFNLSCEPGLGESIDSCPDDCPLPTPTPTPTPTNPYSNQTGAAGTSAGTSITITFFQSDIQATSARFQSTTNIPTNASIFWGESIDFELGTLATVTYDKNHELFITNLKPNTTYYYKIVHKTEQGGVYSFTQQFTTQFLPDVTPPQNSWDIDAVFKTNRIELSWRNPTDTDFKKVLIVRSPQFYPKDQYEGKKVYEGSGNYVYDTDFKRGETYYYSLFTIDEDGNYSSGAVVRIMIPKTPNSTPFFPVEIPKGGTDYDAVTLSDFSFFQNQKQVFIVGTSTVPFETNQSFTMRIADEKLPKGDHILIFTAFDPFVGKEYAFIMKHSTSSKEYSGTVYFDSEKGLYPFHISVDNSKHQLMSLLNGNLDFKPSDLAHITMREKLSQFFSFILAIALILIVLCALFLGIRMVIRKRRRML
jgi:hypothetical protein